MDDEEEDADNYAAANQKSPLIHKEKRIVSMLMQMILIML